MIDAALDFPPERNVEEVFYGAADPQLAENTFSTESGKLIPSSPKVREMFKYTGGSETVDLGSFDACVLVSWCATARFIFRLLGKQAFYLPKHLFSLDQKKTHLLSSSAYQAYLQQGLQNFPSLYPLIEKNIRGEKLVVQQPIKGEESNAAAQTQYADTAFIRKNLYNDLCANYEIAMRDAGARFVPQPPETLTEQFATKREFCLGSVRLFGNDPHEAEEIFHMNKDYGRLCLRGIRSMLNVASA